MRLTKGLAVFLPAAALAAFPAAGLEVTGNDVTVTPSSTADRPHTGTCPVTFTFRGKVALSKQGRFTYRWERSDHAVDTNVHPPMTYNGHDAVIVTTTWTLGARTPAFHPFHGSVSLHILTPEDKVSRPADFWLDCGAPPPTLPPGAIARPTVPGGAAPHVK